MFGAKYGGILAGVFGIGLAGKSKRETNEAKKQAEKETEKYKKTKSENDKKIAEAGDDIEPETYDNADDARNGINDFLDDDS
ncbi:MAG: hypothetical protein ACLFUH_04575 [Bacteroidales bacterium]